MRYPTWRPGLPPGLIYLPHPHTQAGQPNRPYFICDVDEEGGNCQLREGPMSWTNANDRLYELAEQESKRAYAAPLEDRVQRYWSQGYLNFLR